MMLRTNTPWLGLLCLLALSITTVVHAAEGTATLVLEFKDGTGNNLTAKFKPIVSCDTPGEFKLDIIPPDQFEEVVTTDTGQPLEGAKGFDLSSLVQSVLRGAPLSFTVKKEGTSLRRGRRPGADILVKAADLDAEPAKLRGEFRRSDLRIGGAYNAGDPLTLAEMVTVDLTVSCP